MEIQDTKILEVRNLSIDYYTLEGVIHAVRNIKLSIEKGESVCLVGESGSGKSTVGLAIALALPQNALPKGEILYKGRNILEFKENEKKNYLGKEVSIIFQDPAASLNPLFTIGDQMRDIITHHLHLDKEKAYEYAKDMLKKVGLPDPNRVLRSYPHELSGGMLQRVNIAIALSTAPKILIADEPTTMLDVTLQAQILDLLQSLKNELNLSMLFITHNLGVAAEICDRIAVMYAGVLLEAGKIDEVLLNPLHPYTQKLIKCVPTVSIKKHKLSYIPGSLPDPRFLPPGCPFAERCRNPLPQCKERMPSMIKKGETHEVACFRYEGNRNE
ncbi:MAG TPA: ABC transporter ATP-binding protein [Thermoprotei archaeon]|nr:ABC transporter ATP-binding protein [Thermoprotei archaeon]